MQQKASASIPAGKWSFPKVSAIQRENPRSLIEALRQRIADLEGARRLESDGPVSTGLEPLDCLLPSGGLHRGTLVEWLAAADGGGAATLAVVAASAVCRDGGSLVVFDPSSEFYPREAVRLGVRAEDLIVVQTANEADNLWAIDQALRCPAVAAALAWPKKLEPKTFRRLQLAAEQGGSLGFLLRTDQTRHLPSWADVRLAVEPLPQLEGRQGRRLGIELLRGRGGTNGTRIVVEFNDETRTMHLAPELAHPATKNIDRLRRRTGA